MTEQKPIFNHIDHVHAWLSDFNAAIKVSANKSGECKKTLEQLFLKESYWKDALAFTWCLETYCGANVIAEKLQHTAAENSIGPLELDKNATPPSLVNRAGTEVIEAFLTFNTSVARCRGILRLSPDNGEPSGLRAWTFFTAIDALVGFEEKTYRNRPTGESYSRNFKGPNWLDKRIAAAGYMDREPDVLVVGGGLAGLSIAARLTQLGVDTLIVDRNKRVGDNWRNRYHALTLHNQLHVNHLPYMPFPPTWPTYIPKDMLALWFESYAAAMELNFWCDMDVISASFNDKKQRWLVELSTVDGTRRKVSPRHMVMATGVSGIPNLPDIESLSSFAGPTIHSSQYKDGDDWSGKRALVIGCGNSGHDIAQDLHSSGASVTMIQRSPSLVVNIEPSAQFPYKLYDEGRSNDECDFITTSMPTPLVRQAHRHFTKAARSADKTLLEGLKNIGFKLDFGDDDTGWQFKYLTRGGGYYFNVGCSNLLVDGKIDLVQFEQIDHFTQSGVTMSDGKKIEADIIILATGYKPQEVLVEKIFGNDVATRVGPIWGFGEGLELRNMYCQTGQPGLWFIAGSFAQCRINSKYLALQIKAIEEGLMPLHKPTKNL